MNKKELREKAKKNIKYAEAVEKRLKEEFEEVIHNPSEKKIKKYKDVEKAILALWLSKTFDSLSFEVSQAIKSGKAMSLTQLRGKGFNKEDDAGKIYSELLSSKKELLKAELDKIISGIKINSRRNIADMRDAFILQKKKLSEDFFNTFKKYGVAYFSDKAGRRWTLERYVDMLTRTSIVQAERQAFFAKSIEWGNDLVRVAHLGHDDPCPLCQPFQGKVLSITGKTPGYMSVADAESYGLFHPNGLCYLELAPQNPNKYANIQIDEANSKYEARLRL